MHENSASSPTTENPCSLDQANGNQSPTRPAPSGNLALFNDVISATGIKAVRFLFGYGELPVTGEIGLRDDTAELRLFVVVGRLPYTAESHTERRALLGLIRAFKAELDEVIVVSPDQLIGVSGTAPLDVPVTPSALIAAMVRTLHELDPILESLARFLPDLGAAMAVSGRNELEAQAPTT